MMTYDNILFGIYPILSSLVWHSLTDPEIQNTWFEDMDVARLKHHLGDGSKAMSGWWYTYPSDKYESKFGINIPKIWKVVKSSSKPPTRCGYRTKSISLSSVSPWPNIGGIPWGEGTREGTQFFRSVLLEKNILKDDSYIPTVMALYILVISQWNQPIYGLITYNSIYNNFIIGISGLNSIKSRSH